MLCSIVFAETRTIICVSLFLNSTARVIASGFAINLRCARVDCITRLSVYSQQRAVNERCFPPQPTRSPMMREDIYCGLTVPTQYRFCRCAIHFAVARRVFFLFLREMRGLHTYQNKK